VPLDLTDLVAARSETTLQTELLAKLATEGFPTADWQEGSVPRSLVKGDAAALADLDTTVASLANGAFLSTAEGLDDAVEDEEASWLDLLAQERFDETRIAATFAEWTLTLTAGSGIGPYTIGAAALVVASSGGLRFQSTNASNVVVPLAGSVPITVKAQRKGTSGNTATPAVIVSPALPGVTISAQILATSARDREGDDSLRQRCLDTIPGTGAVPIWVSGADENIGSGQLADAQAYVDERKPLTDTPTLSHATEVTVDVSGMTVTFKAGQDTDANRTAARAAIVAYFSALPISTAGDPVTVDEAGVKASVYTALPGKVKDIDWSGTDTTLSSGQVAISSGTGSITFA